MFDNILQYLCVSRSKTIDEKEETFLTNVGNQQVCPYCGQHFSFSIMYNLHVDSCAKSGSMLPDPSQKQFNRSSSNSGFKTKASMTPSKASTVLKKEQLEQIENIVNNLLIQSSQKRQKEELHFLTKYAKNASSLTFLISNDWLKEFLNYLKGGQSYPPGPITNTEISLKVKQAPSQGSLELKALGTNTIVWYFLFRMYGGGPEVYMEGEPSVHFRTSIEAISSKSNNMGRTTQPISKTGHNYEESKLSGYSTDSSLAVSRQYSGNLTGLGITIRGFRNEGFYCYMNSTIQLLFAINELASSLKYGQYRDNIRVSDPKYWKAMAETVALIESNASTIVIPQSLRKLAVTRFRSSEQHDAHEFLLYLLSGMQDEINLPRPKGAVSLNDPEAAWAYYRKYNISLVDQLFAGQLLSILTCGRCKNISKTYEAFLVLTLPMVQHKRRSINECLEMFTMKEEIRSGYECEYCRTRGSAYKQLELSKLPRLLIVHLSRIQMRPRKTKISGYVEFPIRTWRIKMGDYKEEKEYSLLGMVCHTGGVDSGHYTAFIRKDKEWYLCDDSKIKKVSEDNVAGHEAYILLYEQNS